MLDIITYLLGWTSGLFVGIAVGNYVRDYFQRIRYHENIDTISKLFVNSGLFKLMMEYYGINPTYVSLFRQTATSTNIPPTRQEECDIPKPKPSEPDTTSPSTTKTSSTENVKETGCSLTTENDSANQFMNDIVNSLPKDDDSSHTI